MTRFQKWFLKRVFAQEVRQGYFHDLRIENLYEMIRDAARAEFTEDNEISADSYLREWFERTQFRPLSPGSTVNKSFLPDYISDPLKASGKLVRIQNSVPPFYIATKGKDITYNATEPYAEYGRASKWLNKFSPDSIIVDSNGDEVIY